MGIIVPFFFKAVVAERESVLRCNCLHGKCAYLEGEGEREDECEGDSEEEKTKSRSRVNRVHPSYFELRLIVNREDSMRYFLF
jgi:hypothetical protein